MSLTKPTIWSNIQKLVQHNFIVYSNVYISLLMFQIIAIALLNSSTSYFSTDSLHYSIEFLSISPEPVIVLTFIWAFITGLYPTMKQVRNNSLVFVATRTTYTIANYIFLIITMLIGTFFLVFSSSFVWVLHLIQDPTLMIDSVLLLNEPTELFIVFITGFCYLIVIAMVGYLIGAIWQLHKLYGLIIVGLIITVPSIYSLMTNRIDQTTLLSTIFLFEKSIGIFIVKALLIFFLTAILSILITNKVEVKSR